MNSRELLEAAARACGYTVKGEAVDADDYFTHLLVNRGHGTKKFRWNPIEDDADAFRLMVHAGLLVELVPEQQMVIAWDQHEVRYREWWGDVSGAQCEDAYGATRRAIVKAVARV